MQSKSRGTTCVNAVPRSGRSPCASSCCWGCCACDDLNWKKVAQGRTQHQQQDDIHLADLGRSYARHVVRPLVCSMKGTIGPVSQACSSAAAQHAVRPTMSPLSSTLGNHREIPAAAAFHVASAAVGNHTGALPAAVSASVALPLPSSVTTIHKSALLHSAAAANSASQAMPAAPSVRGHAAVHRPGSCSKQQESESEDDSPIRPKCVARSKLLSDSEEEDRIPVKQMGTNAAPSKHDVRQRLSSPRKAPATGAAVSPVKADGPLQKNRVSSSSPISRQDESSDSSTYSDTSSETSSSDRSDSSETSEESGSSESSEGSTSESEDSEEERLDIRKPLKPKRPSSQAARTPPKRAKLQAAAKVRTPDARSRSKSQELSGDEEEGAQIKMGTFDPRNRSTKAKLVAQLLCRWWYVLPEWPPANFDYVTKLNERRLQLVPLEEYEDLDDVDERGFTKVYQISAFPGVFRDPQGRAIDLRPEEGRPCYSNLIKKSEYELIQLVETAIKNQMKSLKESVYDERRTHKKLQMELNEVTKELERFRTREELLKKK